MMGDCLLRWHASMSYARLIHAPTSRCFSTSHSIGQLHGITAGRPSLDLPKRQLYSDPGD